jgi:putative ABC transport system permease protein
MGVRVTREWFRLADVQLLLAVVIGAAGVANTLTISVLTQSRQIALLRAIGASAAQVRRMLIAEAVALGLGGGLTGCLLGWVTLQFILSPLAVKQSGTRLPLLVPYDAMAISIAAGVAIALAAALLPLRAVRRLDIVRAIGYE